MSSASEFLEKLIKNVGTDIDSGKPFKLSMSRLRYPAILSCLKTFAAAPEWTDNDDKDQVLKEVHDLFINLNKAMWEQELQAWPDLKHGSDPEPNSTAVVFGGKYASSPLSIPETLVRMLAKKSSKVYTVSRSSVVGTPPNVIHIKKAKLDEDPQGLDEFVSVLEQALEASERSSRMLIYFTLGQHKGHNPFIRNIVAATNFANALKKVSPELLKTGSPSFGVILTGTDAMLPSTQPDSTMTINGDAITVPTYKISIYNFVYAMSKLCQFYIVADAIVDILQGDLMKELSKELKDTIQKMKTHIVTVGEDGMYHEEFESGISMEELDSISKRSDDILQMLEGHLKVAANISICYTPLHAKPWTDMAFIKCQKESDGSPKAYILQQIVWRLKNAISNEQAAQAHF